MNSRSRPSEPGTTLRLADLAERARTRAARNCWRADDGGVTRPDRHERTRDDDGLRRRRAQRAGVRRRLPRLTRLRSGHRRRRLGAGRAAARGDIRARVGVRRGQADARRARRGRAPGPTAPWGAPQAASARELPAPADAAGGTARRRAPRPRRALARPASTPWTGASSTGAGSEAEAAASAPAPRRRSPRRPAPLRSTRRAPAAAPRTRAPAAARRARASTYDEAGPARTHGGQPASALRRSSRMPTRPGRPRARTNGSSRRNRAVVELLDQLLVGEPMPCSFSFLPRLVNPLLGHFVDSNPYGRFASTRRAAPPRRSPPAGGGAHAEARGAGAPSQSTLRSRGATRPTASAALTIEDHHIHHSS